MLRVGAPGAMDEDARCVCCRVGSCAPGSTSSTSWYSSAIASSAAARWCWRRMLSHVPQNQFPSGMRSNGGSRHHVCHIRSHPSQMSSWSSLSALWQNSQPQSSSSSSFSSSHARCPLEDASAISSLRRGATSTQQDGSAASVTYAKTLRQQGQLLLCCDHLYMHTKQNVWLHESSTAGRTSGWMRQILHVGPGGRADVF